MDYERLTLLQLKKLCKERSLKISGTKDDVVIRLMENDEVNGNPVVQQQAPVQQIFTPQQFMIQKSGNDLLKTLGVFLIIYGVFRIGWAMIFSLSMDQWYGWLLAPVGLMMGMCLLFGGVMIYNEYRSGIFFTIATLLVSGLLSIIFHAEDYENMNPVTLVWGDFAMMMTSIMCSFTFIVIVGMPLIFSHDSLKSGWPPAIERLIESRGSGGKKTIECNKCDNEMLVPSNYSGTIRCPHCKANLKV
ncbi:MAG: SAP domain-containing protein [Candidatus Poseidoniaceae archaeon]|jgi:hypothetical protein|nr:SAP domain-containing protein [Candidatus Poseidoniaceae archaeon]